MSGSYNAGDIEASLRLNRSEFNRELSQAKRDAEDFAKQKYTPKVSLDDAEAKAKITSLKQELQRLRDVQPIRISVSDAEALAQVRILRQELTDLHNVSLGVSLSGLDTATAQLAALKAQVDALNNTPVVIAVHADTHAADASLSALRASAAEPITIHADVDTRTAAASLAALRAAANGEPVTIPARVPGEPGGGGGSRPGPVPGEDENSSRKIKDVTPSLTGLLGLPGIIASVLPQIPTLTTLLAGAAATAVSFGVAAGGAMGTFALATKGAIAQAQSHQKAVQTTDTALKAAQQQLAGTTAGTTAYKNALEKVTQAEKAHKKALDALTPSEKAFNTSLTGVKSAYTSFITATEKYTLSPVTTVLQGAREALPKLVPVVQDLAPAFQNVATAMKNWLSGEGMTTFVRFLRDVGVPIVQNMIAGFRGFLGAGGDLLRAFGPWAVKLSYWFTELGAKVDSWAKGGGVDRFKLQVIGAWRQLEPIFVGLLRLVGDVWHVLTGTNKTNASALTGIVGGIGNALHNITPAAVKAFNEIFQSLADVAVPLAPVLSVTSQAIVDIIGALPPGTIRAIADAMVAWKIAVIGWNAAMAVWGVIQKLIEGVTLAWRVLNFVWVASPIGVIVGIGVILVGVIVLIATKTTWFQQLWHTVWGAIKGVVMGTWDAIKPVFNGIATGFEVVGKIFWKIYITYLKVVFILFEAAVKALWVFGLRPVFGWIADGWHAVGTGIKVAYDHTIGPVWDATANKANSLWKTYLKPIFNGISDSISTAWSVANRNVFSPMGVLFTKTIPGWGDTLKSKLVGAFQAAKDGIAQVWDGVKKAIGSPIYLVARYVWNDAIYTIMDKIAGFVHQKNPLGKINTDSIPHFAAGGPVPHTVGSVAGKDSVHAMLMPDEHVLTRQDVAAMGGQQAVMRFRSALHGGAAVQGANDSGEFGLGGFIDSVGSTLKGVATKTVGALKSAALGALGIVVNPLLDGASSAINKFIPDDGGWDSLANGAMKYPITALKDFIGKKDSSFASTGGGVIPTGQHLAVIDAALQAAGVPPPGTKDLWERGLNTLITRESGWNASAINNWDSNAKAGHPSQGLAQTIPSTFNAYVPSSLRGRGILDPIANVAAAIRYIIATYGNITNVQQAFGSTPKGYYTGTDGASPGLAWVGEKGPELVNFHGGETVYNHQDSMRMAASGLHGYASGTGYRRWLREVYAVRGAYASRDQDTARRDLEQQRYNTAHAKYLNATTHAEQMAAKAEMAKYASQVSRANKEIASDNKLIALEAKRYKSASDWVKQQRADDAVLAAAKKRAQDAERTSIQNWIAAQKATIDAKIQTATDARNGYYSAAVQTGQLSGLTGNRAASFAQQIQNKIKAIQGFQANLHTLAKLGMSQALIQQIAAMGPDQGAQLAQSLARTTTRADAANLNKQYAALETASNSYADSAANDGYGLSTLKKESAALGKMSVSVTAPHTIIVKMDGTTFRAYTEKTAETKITEIVTQAGKKK